MAITIVDLAAVEVVVATRLKAHMVAQANPPLVAYVGEEPPNQDDDGGAKREVSFVGCSITDDDTTQQGGFAKVTAEFIVRAPEALTRANAYAGSGTVSLLSDALLRRVMTHSGTGVTVELSSVTARPVSDPDLSPRDRVFMVTFSGAAWRADGGTSSVFVPGPEQ